MALRSSGSVRWLGFATFTSGVLACYSGLSGSAPFPCGQDGSCPFSSSSVVYWQDSNSYACLDVGCVAFSDLPNHACDGSADCDSLSTCRLLFVGSGFAGALVDGSGQLYAAPAVVHACSDFAGANLLSVCTPDGPATQGQSCLQERCAHDLQCVIIGEGASCEPICSSQSDCASCDGSGTGQCSCTVCYDTNNGNQACQ
jgi:hypothetical protein